jgi:hypothetical protein
LLAMRAEQPVVLDLIARHPSKLTEVDAQLQRSRWLDIANLLRLSDDQACAGYGQPCKGVGRVHAA